MNWAGALVWGFAATAVLTTILSGSQAAGLTRMNIPFMLGTMFTPDRDRAKAVGFLVHFAIGWVLSFLYAAVFQSWGQASLWRGVAIGLAHAMFVLTVVTPLLPSIHPRMAGEQWGPTPTRGLAPPGFFALNYGERTPISVVLAHVLYGAVLGAFYAPV